MSCTDPMERLIKDALIRAGIAYEDETVNAANLDFYLPAYDLYIEVKQLHSDRIAAQMARADNVIVAQGRVGVEALARMIVALPEQDRTTAPIRRFHINQPL